MFPQVMEQRHAESQALLQDESRAVSEQGSSVQHHVEPSRRPGAAPPEAAAFSLSLSFEELSGAGLDEPQRLSNNSHWQVSRPVKELCGRCRCEHVCECVTLTERDRKVTHPQTVTWPHVPGTKRLFSQRVTDLSGFAVLSERRERQRKLMVFS